MIPASEFFHERPALIQSLERDRVAGMVVMHCLVDKAFESFERESQHTLTEIGQALQEYVSKLTTAFPRDREWVDNQVKGLYDLYLHLCRARQSLIDHHGRRSNLRPNAMHYYDFQNYDIKVLVDFS